MKKKEIALLIGNDINNINNGKSWEQLLRNIVDHLGVSQEVDLKNLSAKPFPLLYEEIFLKALAKKSRPEVELKEYIAAQVKTIQYNTIHERIMASGLKDIMTTNYEYSLQSSAAAKN